MKIILASQSPRRLFLLQAAGFFVDVRPSHIDESPKLGEDVQKMTSRLCLEKAKACLLQRDEQHTAVIAADTLVVLGDDVLGQPENIAQAKVMIQKLSGKQHQVYTTVCVRLGEIYKLKTVTTQVMFREISDAEIDVYVQHNDILDKAGAYAIQGGASGFITSIQGSLDNVIGLPVQETIQLLEKIRDEEFRGEHQ
ncbi:MAG: Maf family protein [Ghiorsea sp.]|nr:Maf family protein [Ghiorsea sp.]